MEADGFRLRLVRTGAETGGELLEMEASYGGAGELPPNHGLRPENAKRWRLDANPAAAAAKRREDGPVRLEVFTVEQIETLAGVAESGAWRSGYTQD